MNRFIAAVALQAVALSTTAYGQIRLPEFPDIASLIVWQSEKLDRDPSFRQLARQDSLRAFSALLGSSDVPAPADLVYRLRAGSATGGRLVLGFDYTRGIGEEEASGEGLDARLQGMVLSQVAHFRQVAGKPIFTGDLGFAEAFRDSGLYGVHTEQLGHLVSAVEYGFVVTQIERNPVLLHVARAALGEAQNLDIPKLGPEPRDWAAAALIGHELLGDGPLMLTKQVEEYARMAGKDDATGLRAHFYKAVAAAQKGDHASTWDSIRAIADAGEIPWTQDERRRLEGGESVRFHGQPVTRYGNSVADLALSVYGYAFGAKAAKGSFKNVKSLQAAFLDLFHESGAQAAEVDSEFKRHAEEKTAAVAASADDPACRTTVARVRRWYQELLDREPESWDVVDYRLGEPCSKTRDEIYLSQEAFALRERRPCMGKGDPHVAQVRL